MTTLDWVITSAETEIEQLELVRKIYGLSFGLPNHLSDCQIQVIKHSFLSSLSAANCKLRLESELKIKIRQLIVAEKIFLAKNSHLTSVMLLTTVVRNTA